MPFTYLYFYVHCLQSLLRRVAPSAAPVEMVAKAKSLLEADLKEQRAASEYLPRRPSVLSSRELITSQLVFNFGGGGPSNAGAGSSAPTAPSPSPSPSPLTNSSKKAAGAGPLNTPPSNADDGNNTDYDDVPDEPLPPLSMARPLSSSDQNGAKRTDCSSSDKSVTSGVPVAPAAAATITKSDVRYSGGQCASSISSQSNSERTSTAAATGSLQSCDSCQPQSQSQPQAEVQSQHAAKTPAQSSASKASAAATDKKSVLMKIANAAMGQRVGLTRVRVHKPFAPKDSQNIRNINSSSSSTTNIINIKPAGIGRGSSSSSSSFGLTSSNATSAALKAAASPIRNGPESALKDLHV